MPRGLHPSQTPRASQLPDGVLRASAFGELSLGGGGGEGARVFGVALPTPVPLGGPELPVPLPPPARCQNPGCFGCPPVGGGGRERAFLITCHRFCSTSVPKVTQSPESAPTHLAQCLFCSSGATAQEKSSRSEPSIWEASGERYYGSPGGYIRPKAQMFFFQSHPLCRFHLSGSHR